MPLTAFCTPTGLCELLVKSQGGSASPGWFVKVISEVIKDLTQVAAYLDDVIVFDSDPISHVQTIRSLFERLRKHNLKLSPLKVRLGATDANFQGHSIPPAGLHQINVHKDTVPLPAFCTPTGLYECCLLYTSPSPRDATLSRMPSSA